MPPTDELELDLYSVFATRAGEDRAFELHTLGELAHDGRITACDPFTGERAPFARDFPPGVHSVEVVVIRERNDERIALARVVFSAEVPVAFELAICGDQDPRALAPGQRFGYGVDAGTGCFAVPGSIETLDTDALLAEFNDHRRITWGWGVAEPMERGHQVVAFSSGCGDGIYSTYVGLSAGGTPVCLVTDFSCVDLVLPELPDDLAFRRRHATDAYERMMAAVPGLGGAAHGDAYTASAELVASPADAVHLVGTIVDHLRAARSPLHQDLYRSVLGRLAAAAEVQHVLAPHLATLDNDTCTRVTDGKALDTSWIVAVRALWSAAEPELRANILTCERAWSWREDTVRDPELLAHALEAIASEHDALLRAGLDVLGDELADADRSLPDSAVEQLQRISATAPSGIRTKAMNLMVKLGHDLGNELVSTDPVTRLAAACALGRNPSHAARADAVLIDLAHDATLDPALRFEAAGRIQAPAALIAAYVTLGLAGAEAAPIQLRYVGGKDAIAGLERLAAEATSPRVRQQAATYVVIARELEANRAL